MKFRPQEHNYSGTRKTGTAAGSTIPKQMSQNRAVTEQLLYESFLESG